MVVLAARAGGEVIPPKPDSKAVKTEEFLAAFVQFVADRAYGLEHSLLGREPLLHIARFPAK